MRIPRLGAGDLFGLYLAAALVLFGATFAGDPGLGWHLRTGEWIAEHNALPFVDPFLIRGLLSNPEVWVDNQWLAQVLLWLGWRSGGPAFVHAAAIALCVAPFVFVLMPLLCRASQSVLLVFAAALLAALMAKLQWFIRPVIVSFVFSAVVYRCLELRFEAAHQGQLRSYRGFFLFMPVLFALWANIHPAFCIGLALIALFAAAAFIQGFFSKTRRRELRQFGWASCAVLIFSCLASMLNPYGLGLHRDILALLSSPYFMNLNQEWLPPDLSIPFVPFWLSTALFIGFSAAGGRRALSAADILLCAVFLLLALNQRRYIPFFSIVFALPFVKSAAASRAHKLLETSFGRTMGEMDSRLSTALSGGSQWQATALLLAGVLGFAMLFDRLPFREPLDSEFPRRCPKEAAAVISRGAEGRCRVFNHPDWGGYLIWSLFPRCAVFADDRNGVTPVQRYEQFFQAQRGAGWESLVLHYDFQWALLQDYWPLTAILAESPDWELVYRSPENSQDRAVLYRRRAEATLR